VLVPFNGNQSSNLGAVVGFGVAVTSRLTPRFDVNDMSNLITEDKTKILIGSRTRLLITHY
jgi:hypothetical protein